MARNTTLADVLLMVKAEMGYDLTTGAATQQDQELYWRIFNKQSFLAGEFDWPFLETRRNVICSAGTRLHDLPNDAGVQVLNHERPCAVSVQWSAIWSPLDYGIDNEHFNTVNSDMNDQQDPICRWQYAPDDQQFEVWPIPVTEQIVRFVGQKPLTLLRIAGVYDPTATLDLDDQMIVLFVVADLLTTQKRGDAALALQKAQRRMSLIRANYSTRSRVTVLRGDRMVEDYRCHRRPVSIGGSSSGGMGLLGESGSVILGD